MLLNNLELAKSAIETAYNERHVDTMHTGFGEGDEVVLDAMLHGKETFSYDSLNDCLELTTAELSGVPTALVITYRLNKFNTKTELVPLELNAMCGGTLTPLCRTMFRPSDLNGLKDAVDLLYLRSHSVVEGLKREA